MDSILNIICKGVGSNGLTYSICIDVAFLLVLFDSYSLFGRYTNLPSKFEDLFLRYKLALARMPKFKLVYFLCLF